MGIFLLIASVLAVEINGYTPARHDRFSSFFPSALVANTNSNFIGLGYDWSGVGWNPSNTTQSFALLGPKFFLYSDHYLPGSTLQFLSSNGQLKSYSVLMLSGSISGTSDLGVGVLASPIPASDNVNYYPILFLGYSPDSYFAPTGANNILIYGRQGDGSSNGPRIGVDAVTTVANGITTTDDNVFHSGYYFGYTYDATVSPTPADIAHIEIGDSGSPSFFYSSDTHTLYLAGAHFAASATQAYDTALPMMLNYVDAYMAQTGYLPYVVTPVTDTWTGNTNFSWGVDNNWTNHAPADVLTGGVVTTCASVLFDGSATTRRTINLNGNQTVTSITFKADAGGHRPFTIAAGTSGTLTIGEAGITNSDDDVQIITCNVALRSSQRWSVGTVGLSVSGPIDTGSSSPGNLLLIDGGGTTTLSGLIYDSGGLAKDGLGTLILSGASTNTYSGQTFINGGVLQVGNGGTSGTLGAGSMVDNATLVFNRSNNIAVTNIINGTGALQQNGAGTLTLSGANGYSGITIVFSGVIQLANSTALGSTAAGTIVQNSGTLDLNGLSIGNEPVAISGAGGAGIGALVNNNSSSAALLGGPVTLGNNATAGGTGNSSIFGAMNYGNFAFTKNGTGVLTLSGAQIWGNNASATVNSGTLFYVQAPGAATSIGANTPTVHIAAGALVNVNAYNNDPFTDDSVSTKHVQIVDDATGNFLVTGGTVSVAGISGAGSTGVWGGATLYSNYIYQDQLSIGPGSTVVINPIGGLNALPDLLSGNSFITSVSNLASTDTLSEIGSPRHYASVNRPYGFIAGTRAFGMLIAPYGGHYRCCAFPLETFGATIANL